MSGIVGSAVDAVATLGAVVVLGRLGGRLGTSFRRRVNRGSGRFDLGVRECFPNGRYSRWRHGTGRAVSAGFEFKGRVYRMDTARLNEARQPRGRDRLSVVPDVDIIPVTTADGGEYEVAVREEGREFMSRWVPSPEG